MTEPHITPAELQALMSDTEQATVAIEQPLPPCDVYCVTGRIFHVKDVDAWQWHDHGIFCTGNWIDAPQKEVDVVIPFDRIEFVQFDFDALQKFLMEGGDSA